MSARRLTIIFCYFFGLAGLIIIGRSFFDQLACEGQLLFYARVLGAGQQVWGERIISQSFIAPHNNLNRIDTLLETSGRKNTEDVTLRLLEVSDSVDNPLQGLELFSTTFNASTVREGKWHTITFPQIPDSASKTYLISLQSPASTPDNAIAVNGVQKDIYPPGSAYLGPVPVPFDLAFRACFQMTVFEKLQLLGEYMSRYRPALWGSTLFYLLGLISYALLSIGFFWRLTKWAW